MVISIQDICQAATRKVRAAKSEELHEKYGNNTIVLFEDSYKYTAYGKDAEILSEHCNVLTSLFAEVQSAEFRRDKADIVFPRLVRLGYKIAITNN